MPILRILKKSIPPFFISLLCFAMSGCSNPRLPSSLAGIVANNSFPTNPMREGMREIKVSPAYFIANTSEGERGADKGGAIGLSYIYAFSPHLGIGLSGAYGEGRGSVAAKQGQSGLLANWSTDPSKYSGNLKEKGWAAAFHIILDPFSDPDGVRMPVTISAFYLKGSLDYHIPFKFTCCGTHTGHDGEQSGSYSSRDNLTAMLTIPVQFNTGNFRWSPFIHAYGPMPTYLGRDTVKDTTTGETIEDHPGFSWQPWPGSLSFGAGIPVTYQPLGLTFAYVAENVYWEGAVNNLFLLSWTKSW